MDWVADIRGICSPARRRPRPLTARGRSGAGSRQRRRVPRPSARATRPASHPPRSVRGGGGVGLPLGHGPGRCRGPPPAPRGAVPGPWRSSTRGRPPSLRARSTQPASPTPTPRGAFATSEAPGRGTTRAPRGASPSACGARSRGRTGSPHPAPSRRGPRSLTMTAPGRRPSGTGGGLTPRPCASTATGAAGKTPARTLGLPPVHTAHSRTWSRNR